MGDHVYAVTRAQAERFFWVGYLFGIAFGVAIGVALGFWWSA